MATVRAIAGLLSVRAAMAVALAVLSSPAQAGTTVRDAGGREVQILDTSKILSIGGDITEILYALGVGARIVAVDTTSQFPPEALKQKPKVGYMRALSAEGVLSVGASLIIASERAGPPEVIKVLRQSSTSYVEVPEGLSPQGVVDKVRFVASAIAYESEGKALADRLEQEFRALAGRRASIKQPLRALFVLIVQNGRATVGGAGTAADAIMKLAGAENAAASINGFRPVVDEALVELQPDALIVMRRSSGEHDTNQLLSLKGMQNTPAGAARRVVVMDALYLLGFGPRTPAAASELMRAFYPALSSSSLRSTPSR
jgi:iron complex transport system substrate-binding protein